MAKPNIQPGEASIRSHVALGLVCTALYCAGCASPGPPKPPSLRLPRLVTDLSAERQGGEVLLRWTTPSRTTDEQDIAGPLTAEICRETDAIPSKPEARLAACAPVRRLTVAPGPSEAADALPPALQAEPARLIAYRIQIFNSAGRSAGNSAIPARAAAGQAPPDVANLRARASEQGAVLEWQSEGARTTSAAYAIDLSRVDLSAPAAPGRTARPAPPRPAGKARPAAHPAHTGEETADELHLRAADSAAGSASDTAGTVDTTAAMGGTYAYAAQRVRTVDLGNRTFELKSAPSVPVTVTMRDTFPPKPPAGLETISGNTAPDSAANGASPQPYIDLSWEPNTEPDLAGYRVYRQLARPDGSPQGPLARLTALPIAVPAYRDVAVKAGQGYIYSVTAVDAAGNESAPSAKTLEFASAAVSDVPPREAGGPPH